MTVSLTLLSAAPGTCPVCATAHDADLPHNRNSLNYQISFYREHRRLPSWADAMAHCDAEVRIAAIKLLSRQSFSVSAPARLGEVETGISTLSTCALIDLLGREQKDRITLPLCAYDPGFWPRPCPVIAPGVRGVLIEHNGTLYIPVVMSDAPSQGNVSRWLDSLPRDKTIVFPEVVSAILHQALLRRGFVLTPGLAAEWEEITDSLVRKPIFSETSEAGKSDKAGQKGEAACVLS